MKPFSKYESKNSINDILNLAQIIFNVNFNLNKDETLYLIGNIEELGNWDPLNSLEMKPISKDGTLYKSTSEIIITIGINIEYRYIIKDKNNEIHWEQIDNNNEKNRKLIIDSPGKYIIFDNQNSLNNQVQCINNSNLILNNFVLNSTTAEEKNLEGEISDINKKSDLVDLFSFENNNIFQDNDYEVGTDNINILQNLSNKFPDLYMDKNLKNTNITITSDDRILIVTSLLPFEIEKNPDYVPPNEEELPEDLDENDPKYIKEISKKYLIKTNNEKLVNLIIYNLKEKQLCKVKWIGLLKYFYRFNEEELYEIDLILRSKNINMLLNISKTDYINYWEYINKIISPVFIDCNINISNKYFVYHENYLKSFKKVNEEFGKLIKSIAKNDDLIYISDINLSLVPNYLLQKNINYKIGIYFHISFPPSEVFRIFPFHSEILKSILLCDIIGFHSFKHAKNFLNSLYQEFDISYRVKTKGNIYINYYGRDILIYIKNVEVDVDYMRKLVKENKESFNAYYDKYKKIINNKNFVFTAIEYQYDVPKILILLDCYYDYLQDCYNNKTINTNRTILILKISFDNSIEDKKDINDYLENKVNEIKEKFGEDILYIDHYNEMQMTEKFALFNLTNILISFNNNNGLDTSHREFIFSHSISDVEVQNNQQSNKIGLIISENNETSYEIKNCYRINPFNKSDLIKGIKKIISLPDSEVDSNLTHDIKFISQANTFQWMSNFMNNIKYLGVVNAENSQKISLGMKYNFRILQNNKEFKALELKKLNKSYHRSECRYFFINYEDVLIYEDDEEETNISNLENNEYGPQILRQLYNKRFSPVIPTEILNNINNIPEISLLNKPIPSENTKEKSSSHLISDYLFYKAPNTKDLSILNNLAKDPKNRVIILTKHKNDLYNQYFSEYNNIGFACEYGMLYKKPSESNISEIPIDISCNDLNENLDTIIKILNNFSERTEGSYISIRQFSISWNYENCDSYLGKMQANELTVYLKNIFEEKNIDVVNCNEFVEIKPKNLNKGYFISYVLQNEIKMGSVPDFVCAIGNYGEDEDMFKYLNTLNKNLKKLQKSCHIFSCVIGNNLTNTNANYYFRSNHELFELLDTISHK